MDTLRNPFGGGRTTLPCLYWRHEQCAGDVHRALMPTLWDRFRGRRPVEVVPCECLCHYGAYTDDHPTWGKPTA